MILSRLCLAALAALFVPSSALADIPGGSDTFSSFEFTDMTGEFTVGNAPYEVTCIGGFADIIGVLELYHSGVFAWMVSPGGTATAVFDTPAKQLRFYTRTQNPGTTATVTVFGTDGSVLGTFNPGSASWTTVFITSTTPHISHFTIVHTGGTGVVAVDDMDYCANDTGTSWCVGNGGDGMGCTNCPCGNNAPASLVGGCLNSNLDSARLLGTGTPSVAADSLHFNLRGAPPTAFCILNSGDNIAPTSMANPCFGLNSGAQAMVFDGLRCAVGNTRRHGGRGADANGDVGFTNNGWGPPNGPMIGLAAQGGFVSGQTRHFQVINRDDPMLVCTRGLNTSQAVSVTFQP